MDQSAAQPATKSGSDVKAAYRVVMEPGGKRVRVVFAGKTVADSMDVVVLHETRLPPQYYFPRKDVRMEFLRRTEHRTHCPFKGNASYWTIEAGNQVADNVVWSYEDPLQDVRAIRDYLAFTWNAMEAWYEDEEQILEQVQDATPFNLNIFSDWLLSDAWSAASDHELVIRLSHCLFSSGVPVWRLQLLTRTLHPLLFATRYTWWRDTDEVEIYSAPHDILETREHKESPYAPVLDGAGGVRRSVCPPFSDQACFTRSTQAAWRQCSAGTLYVATGLKLIFLLAQGSAFRSNPGICPALAGRCRMLFSHTAKSCFIQ